MAQLPALAVTAVPRRRRQVLDLALEIENRGFAGLYTPSTLGGMAFCEAMSVTTKSMPFGISIAPIYSRTVDDFADLPDGGLEDAVCRGVGHHQC